MALPSSTAGTGWSKRHVDFFSFAAQRTATLYVKSVSSSCLGPSATVIPTRLADLRPNACRILLYLLAVVPVVAHVGRLESLVARVKVVAAAVAAAGCWAVQAGRTPAARPAALHTDYHGARGPAPLGPLALPPRGRGLTRTATVPPEIHVEQPRTTHTELHDYALKFTNSRPCLRT